MDIQKIISEAFYTFENLPDEKPLITIQGKTVATQGNFITINGMPKSYKTTVMNFFIYSAISGNEIFDINVELNKNESIVLIDTEQSKFDFNRQYKRLKHLCRNNNLDQLKTYLFRKFDHVEILKSIEYIIETQNPKYLIIDNLTELVLNPNDMVEAKNIVQLLKRLTETYKTCIIALLHLGKTNFNTLGNLGSYSDRGVQTSIKLSYEAETEIVSIAPSLMRSDRHFETINIKYNTDINFFERVTGFDTEKPKKKAYDIMTEPVNVIKDNLLIAFGQNKKLIYSDLVIVLNQSFGVGNNTVKQKIIPYLLRIELIKKFEGFYIL